MKVTIEGWSKPKNCLGCPFNNSDCFCNITHSQIDRDFWDTDEECPITEISEN